MKKLKIINGLLMQSKVETSIECYSDLSGPQIGLRSKADYFWPKKFRFWTRGKRCFLLLNYSFMKKICNLGVKSAIFPPENLPIYR
jgi:hypothetical protein